MSIAIYYKATRKAKLSESEIHLVGTISGKYSVDSEIEEYLRTGSGRNWESFAFRTNTQEAGLFRKAVILEGATKLPDNSENATWEGVQHWCKCLTEIRRSLPGTDWNVSVNDHPIPWDAKRNEFDASR